MPTSEEPYTDEIDLIELLSVLWSGKWWILGITGAALAGAFSWLALTKPSYESEAIITAPSLADYNDIYPGFLAGEAPEPDEVLREVMNYMASPDQQRAFLAKHIETETQQDEALTRALEALKVSENQGGDLQSASINLRYTATDPEKTRTVVEGFVNESNESVIDQLARDARSRVTTKVSTLAAEIKTKEKAHKKNLEQQIARLEAAEKRARAYGIKTNQHHESSAVLMAKRLQEPLFEYGTRALSALIDNHQQKLQQLQPQTIQQQSRQQSWQSLDINTENTRALSVYQSASEAKRTRSSILVMALAGILGLMLGGVAVLLRQAWRNAAR